jgi:hypothetical protein
MLSVAFLAGLGRAICLGQHDASHEWSAFRAG